MFRCFAVPAILAASVLAATTAGAEPLEEGRSTYAHHHYHAAHYYHMTHRHHHGDGHYVVGGHHHRGTATGGNPGGYADRN